MLTCHQRGPVTIPWGQFHYRYPSHQAPKFAWKLPLKFHSYLQGSVRLKKLLSWMIHLLFAARPAFCLSIGYVIQGTTKLLGALPKLFRNPRAILLAIKHPDNFRLAAFLGYFFAIFKVIYTWNLELLKSHQQANQGNHDILYFLDNSLVSWVCGNNFKCVIFKDTHVFHWLVSETFRLKFYAVECHRISLMLTEHWFR